MSNTGNYAANKNTLDCDRSNYFSRIVFSYISILFDPSENSAIPSENPTLEPNMKSIWWAVADHKWPFEIFQMEDRSVCRTSAYTDVIPLRLHYSET